MCMFLMSPNRLSFSHIQPWVDVSSKPMMWARCLSIFLSSFSYKIPETSQTKNVIWCFLTQKAAVGRGPTYLRCGTVPYHASNDEPYPSGSICRGIIGSCLGASNGSIFQRQSWIFYSFLLGFPREMHPNVCWHTAVPIDPVDRVTSSANNHTPGLIYAG